MTVKVMVVLACVLLAFVASVAHAQSREASMRSTLRGGTPNSRLPATTRTQPPVRRQSVSSEPSITLGPTERGATGGSERRSLQLLDREIGLLRRLVGNMRHTDPRRPAVLLRLSQAYVEKVWVLKVRQHALRERSHGTCACTPLPAPGVSAPLLASRP
jgi:hypothetical protein